MKLEYKKDHISIKYFEPIEIQEFTVLTGMNGSGKTHLLDAIKKGHIEIDNVDKSEIVYYNYNDFTIFTGNPQQNPIYANRTHEWNNEKNLYIQRINQIKQKAKQESQKEKSTTDKIIYTFAQQSDFDFETWLGQQKDYDIIQELKKEENITQNITSYQNRLTPHFFNFLTQYLVYDNGDINDLTIDKLKPRFTELAKELEFAFKKENEGFYGFLKSSVVDKSIFSITPNDFESPNLFLEDIANEEKEYQFTKTNNSLDKLNAIDWNEKTNYLEKDEFIKKFGLSPIEQIDEVLNEYDCNGYFLTTNKFQAQLGLDKAQMQIQINLKQKEAGYTTTFDQLSSGEKTLIALSLLIYKSRKKRIIPRVLLLDEVDSSLHPSMIKRLLNVIQELFIKRQGLLVILATHSPTTVALSPDDSIFIITKNGSEKITKQEKAVAINILTEGFATINTENTNLSIEYNISQTKLPVLFTEGITDKIIIETAWKKINGLKKMPFYVQNCFDASFLANLFRRGYDAQDGIFISHSDRILIALFDFDYEGYNAWNSLSKLSQIIESEPTKSLTKQNPEKNAFAILLPVSNNAEITKQVIKSGLETYENESALQIELLFYGVSGLEKYFSKESTRGGGEIISFKGKKRDFANALIKLKPTDFDNLKPLFDKINEIVSTNAQKQLQEIGGSVVA